MEGDYSKREIDLLIENVKQHINDTITTPLARIEEQTTKTNGRVTALENWRNYIAGCVVVITLVILPYLFILIK